MRLLGCDKRFERRVEDSWRRKQFISPILTRVSLLRLWKVPMMHKDHEEGYKVQSVHYLSSWYFLSCRTCVLLTWKIWGVCISFHSSNQADSKWYKVHSWMSKGLLNDQLPWIGNWWFLTSHQEKPKERSCLLQEGILLKGFDVFW